MSQFAKKFSVKEIGQQPVAQISWGTLITVIIPKSKSHEEMLWYINKNQAKVIIKFINKFIDTFLIIFIIIVSYFTTTEIILLTNKIQLILLSEIIKSELTHKE